MNKKILMPLAQNDRAEDPLPRESGSAREDGCLLMRYPVGAIKWPK